MTEEVTRSKQTLQQEKQPKFGSLIMADQPKKKAVIFITTTVTKRFLTHEMTQDETGAGWDGSSQGRCEAVK